MEFGFIDAVDMTSGFLFFIIIFYQYREMYHNFAMVIVCTPLMKVRLK